MVEPINSELGWKGYDLSKFNREKNMWNIMLGIISGNWNDGNEM